jgi:hypothetical protein
MAQDNPYAKYAVPSANPYAGYVAVGDPDPAYRYKGAQAAAELEARRLQNAKLAREAAQQDEPAIDPATVSYMAQQVLAGGQMPALGMGKQAAAARQAVMAEVARQAGARGLNGADLATQVAHYKAGSKQIANLENMAGTIGVNEQTALTNGQQFLDRSRELPGQTRFAPLNAISDWVQRRFGGTTISAADAAYNTFVNEYAKVVAGSPSGAGTLSDSARHEAMSTINGSGSVDQKQSAFDQMKTDMANRMAAIHAGINGAYKGLTNQPGFSVPESTAALVAQAVQGHQGGLPNTGGDTGAGGSSGPGGTPPPGPAGMGIGSGPGGMAPDPDRQKVVDQLSSMLASGRPDDEVTAFAKGAGIDPAASGLLDNLKYRRANHGYGSFGPNVAPAMKPQLQPAFSLNGGTSPLGTYAMSAANALTGNTLDNMTADPALARAGLAGASAANPTSGLLGDITGAGLAAAGTELGVGAAAGRAGISAASPWVARGADALFGGVSGAGAADDSSRLGGALLGAGAGVGGGMFGRKVGGMFAKRGAPSPLNAGENLLATRAKQIGPASITDQLAEAQRLGVPMSLADTGAQMATLGGQVVRRSPDAAQIAQDTFGARARGQIDRLGQSVTTNLGPVGNVPQMSEDLLKQARTQARPLYDAAYAAPGAGAAYPQIKPFLAKPSVQNALGRARNIAAEEGRDPTTLGFDLDPQGNPTLTRVPSWQTLDYVKRGLDDTVDAARDPLTQRLNTAGNAINDTRKSFLSTLDNANPLYGQARRAYAGPMEATNALQAGQDAFTANPNQLGVDLANTAPGNISQMQLGYRGALMDRANSARYASNPFDATLGTPAAEQRLASLYPNNPGNAALLRTRDLEGQLARTNNTVLGNSLTAARQIADADFAANPLIEAGLHGAAAMATGGATLPGTAARIAGLGLKDRVALGLGNKAVAKADQIAPYVFNTNPAEASNALTALLARQNAYRAYIDNSTGRRLGGMFGAGLGLLPVAGQ